MSISVERILDRFAHGWSEEQLLESCPHLKKQDLQALFGYLNECVKDGLIREINRKAVREIRPGLSDKQVLDIIQRALTLTNRLTVITSRSIRQRKFKWWFSIANCARHGSTYTLKNRFMIVVSKLW